MKNKLKLMILFFMVVFSLCYYISSYYETYYSEKLLSCNKTLYKNDFSLTLTSNQNLLTFSTNVTENFNGKEWFIQFYGLDSNGHRQKISETTRFSALCGNTITVPVNIIKLFQYNTNKIIVDLVLKDIAINHTLLLNINKSNQEFFINGYKITATNIHQNFNQNSLTISFEPEQDELNQYIYGLSSPIAETSYSDGKIKLLLSNIELSNPNIIIPIHAYTLRSNNWVFDSDY